MKDKTFEELAKDETGTIYHDEYDEGIRFIIMRGPGALCAYVGIPEKHPLAGHDYDSLPVSAHGGLTYSRQGTDDDYRPVGFWWYGWDYGHIGDKSFYDLDYPRLAHNNRPWTVEEVKKDSWEALYDFKALMKLAEKIHKKAKRNEDVLL